jgi:hypothetical protein
MALAESLNQANDPFGFSKIAAEKSPVTRGEMARKAIPDVLREKADAERAVMELKERQNSSRHKKEQKLRKVLSVAYSLLRRLCNKKLANVLSVTFRNLIPMQALNLPH